MNFHNIVGLLVSGGVLGIMSNMIANKFIAGLTFIVAVILYSLLIMKVTK